MFQTNCVTFSPPSSAMSSPSVSPPRPDQPRPPATSHPNLTGCDTKLISYRNSPTSQVFAQRNPRYLLRIVNRHDEFFALVMLFVERHYLKTWGTPCPFCRPPPTPTSPDVPPAEGSR